MTVLVLDASVAVKWFLPGEEEPLAEEAETCLRGLTEGDIGFMVPDLFWAEFGNIIWKAVRQKRCTRDQAEQALGDILSFDFLTIPSGELLEEAFSLAASFDQTVYDCLYLALAMREKVQFLTADERLANSLAAMLPVKWLGMLEA